MNLSPEEKKIGKQNFNEAVGTTRRTFLQDHRHRRRHRRGRRGWAPSISATGRSSMTGCASASSARATKAAC